MIRLGDKVYEYGHYPDGTLNIKLTEEEVSTAIAYKSISWYYDSEEELVVLIYLLNALRSQRITGMDLYMPYVPNARMDRCENANDVFTLKYFADIINSFAFRFVKTLDVHSTVAEALINNISNESPVSYIQSVMGQIVSFTDKEFTIFYPDAGAMKRYSKMIEATYVFGNKVRDWDTGVIKGLDVIGDVELVKEHDILIVDDICSRGGTFYHSAKKLKELGANDIYLYITHCENTILEGELINSGLVKRIYTTDTIFTKQHELIEIVANFRGGNEND